MRARRRGAPHPRLRRLPLGLARLDRRAPAGEAGTDPRPRVLRRGGRGRTARRWQVGDRVVAPFILACGRCPACQAGHQNICPDQRLPGFVEPGAFAEYVAVPFAHNLARLPDAMTPAIAAALGCRATTAWHALTGAPSCAPANGSRSTAPAASASRRCSSAGRSAPAWSWSTSCRRSSRTPSASAPRPRVDARDGDAAAAIRELTGGGAHVSVEALGIAADRPTPRSSACGRSAATFRSGCRSATPRAWRST